ncbi:MAG: hypothetical protein UIQ67_04490 [Bacteroidales bacterium]|nr:hypothetical protein [Bacteroidales bacterium]
MDIFGFEDGGLFGGEDILGNSGDDSIIDTADYMKSNIDSVSFHGEIDDLKHKKYVLEGELKDAQHEIDYYSNKIEITDRTSDEYWNNLYKGRLEKAINESKELTRKIRNIQDEINSLK